MGEEMLALVGGLCNTGSSIIERPNGTQMESFLSGTTPGLRLSMCGIAIAALGALCCIIFNFPEQGALANAVMFGVVVLGMVTGAAGILRILFVETREEARKGKQPGRD